MCIYMSCVYNVTAKSEIVSEKKIYKKQTELKIY